MDLWSLFDFLMPGFLGTQRQFHDRFGRAILSSRDAKSSSKEQEAGMCICTPQVVLECLLVVEYAYRGLDICITV